AAGAWETPLLRSGLVFAREERLTSREVTGLDLHRTELVALAGGEGGGQGPPLWGRLSALVHSFLHAGARHVLVRLWRAEPEGPFLKLVYERLSQGRPLHAAPPPGSAEGGGAGGAGRRGRGPAGCASVRWAIEAEGGRRRSPGPWTRTVRRTARRA